MKLPDGVRAELIEGELFMMSPSPQFRHQRVVGNLFRILDRAVRASGRGEVLVAPLDVHLPGGDIVQPDLIVILNENRHIVQDWIRGTPDLLVEILSPTSPERDRFVKRNVYARNGVPEYWIVDDDTRSIEVLALDGAAYAPAGYFTGDEAVVSPLIGSLDVKTSAAFA